MAWLINAAFLSVCLLSCLTGCATSALAPRASLHFRVVDATTGQAIEGVTVTEHSYVHDLALGKTSNKRSLVNTDAKGSTTADGLQKGLAHQFLFEKSGYCLARVLWPRTHPDFITLDTFAEKDENASSGKWKEIPLADPVVVHLRRLGSQRNEMGGGR